LLAGLRDGTLAANSEIISALLSLVDAIRQMLSDISLTGQEGKREYPDLINTLTRLQKTA